MTKFGRPRGVEHTQEGIGQKGQSMYRDRVQNCRKITAQLSLGGFELPASRKTMVHIDYRLPQRDDLTTNRQGRVAFGYGRFQTSGLRPEVNREGHVNYGPWCRTKNDVPANCLITSSMLIKVPNRQHLGSVDPPARNGLFFQVEPARLGFDQSDKNMSVHYVTV